MNRIKRKCWNIFTQCVYGIAFNSIGENTTIIKPVQIDNAHSMRIGKESYIAEGAWLLGGDTGVTIEIGNGVTIGHYSHIVGIESLLIDDNVLIADRVFISDCTHTYEDINNPLYKQPIKTYSSVIIGEGSWLGENVCVCGASVGKHCVIGANSVVTSDIPDYCVAVGSPARVVKKYDFEKNEWVKL